VRGRHSSREQRVEKTIERIVKRWVGEVSRERRASVVVGIREVTLQ
jgi:hypothetical protein